EGDKLSQQHVGFERGVGVAEMVLDARFFPGPPGTLETLANIVERRRGRGREDGKDILARNACHVAPRVDAATRLHAPPMGQRGLREFEGYYRADLPQRYKNLNKISPCAETRRNGSSAESLCGGVQGHSLARNGVETQDGNMAELDRRAVLLQA